MHLLLIYDIPDDRTRSRIADACLDFGLDRIQYSAFYGRLSRAHRESLMVLLEQTLGELDGSMQLIVVCDTDWRKRVVLEQGDYA